MAQIRADKVSERCEALNAQANPESYLTNASLPLIQKAKDADEKAMQKAAKAKMNPGATVQMEDKNDKNCVLQPFKPKKVSAERSGPYTPPLPIEVPVGHENEMPRSPGLDKLDDR